MATKKARKAPKKVNKRTTLGYAAFRLATDDEGRDFLRPLGLVDERVGKKSVSYLDDAGDIDGVEIFDIDGFATRGSAQAAINRSLKYNNHFAAFTKGDFVVVKIIG